MGVFSLFGDFMIDTLSIVNDMLATLGEAPINDIDAAHPLVPRAVSTLDTVNYAVQSDSWWFNTEQVTLTPQVGTNEILLPSDCLSVDAVDRTPRVTFRNGRLYNSDTASYTFTKSVPSARAYIGARAVQKFQTNIDGDSTKMRELKADTAMAYIVFNAEHIRNSQVNFLARSGVQEILNSMRGTRVRGIGRY
jgi:hypothetical protein